LRSSLGSSICSFLGEHCLLFTSTAHAARGARVLRASLGLCLAAPPACPRSHGSFPSSIASSTSKIERPELEVCGKVARSRISSPAAGAAPPPRLCVNSAIKTYICCFPLPHPLLPTERAL
jgi:hypothetical protein